MSVPELCIIFNPAAGRRRAAGRLSHLRHQWGTRADFWPTRHAGHAEELAFQAAHAGFAVVTAAGGDGTVHEVANGLLRAGRPEVIFGVAPIGSANDYAYSLRHDGSPAPAGVRAVDVGAVRDATGRQRYFVCCLGLGLNGAVTLESRRIKRLQGLALYGLATLRAVWYHHAFPMMTLTVDDEPPRSAPTLMLSVLLGQREGGFVLAPEARLDDGLFDYVLAGALSRWEVLRYLPRLAHGGPPKDHPKVRLGRCRQLGLCSEAPLTVHIDGEFFSRPEDNVRSLDIRLLPGALRVQLFPASYISVRANLLTTLGIFGTLVFPRQGISSPARSASDGTSRHWRSGLVRIVRAGVISPGVVPLEILGRQAVKESPFYQQIQAEARVEDILQVLGIRFGAEKAVPFQEALQPLWDTERLAELLTVAVKCRRLADFRRALNALPSTL